MHCAVYYIVHVFASSQHPDVLVLGGAGDETAEPLYCLLSAGFNTLRVQFERSSGAAICLSAWHIRLLVFGKTAPMPLEIVSRSRLEIHRRAAADPTRAEYWCRDLIGLLFSYVARRPNEMNNIL
jgi:hypothetical protein